MASVYVVQRDDATYAESTVREMIQELFHAMRYDDERYGTPEWNPFVGLITPGDKVVVKPNLVMDHNEDPSVNVDAMECLVTQTPVIGVICDYCIKALQGRGQIIVGDAPMQGCDFAKLVEKTGLRELVDSYRDAGIQILLKDFREYQASVNKHAVRVGKTFTDAKGIVVHLGERSLHYKSGSNEEYQVSDYDIQETKRLHHNSTHDYVIAQDILEADVIINLCKPKTHRLAGFTGAMKNMVGCTYNKASLPHRSAGSAAEHGDAYLNKSFLKRMADRALTAKVRAENHGHLVRARLLRYVYGANLIAARRLSKDRYFIGSWYGNDTIWRTVCDLNHIVLFADKNGVIRDTPQRKMLSIGDMIIAGEGNGPVKPTPKYLGAIVASEDARAFDIALCRIMGFTYDRIPLVRHLMQTHIDSFVNINGNEALIGELIIPVQWTFKSHESWKD